MVRRFLLCACALSLIAAACGSEDKPTSYELQVDAPSPEGQKLQFSAFHPAQIRVSPGDRVAFRNAGTESAHTIAFGVASDRSNQPPIVTDRGLNPVVESPCFSEDPPTTKLVECPHGELPAYGGTGYWNSGFIPPAPGPHAAGRRAVAVELDVNIALGTYTFLCVLHPSMAGSIAVVQKTDRSAPDDLREAGQKAVAASLAAAKKIPKPTLEREGTTVTVSAGWGDDTIAVNRFEPAQLEIDPDTTVRWVARGPYGPHTVTFKTRYESAVDPRALRPGGVESGSKYRGGFANSGMLGPEDGPYPSEPFSLRFTKPGPWTYQCLFHPGQTGVVTVRPR